MAKRVNSRFGKDDKIKGDKSINDARDDRSVH